ncbi:MAG: radical SAM protein [Terriglobia bacterium]|jgi:hypothetical protein
MLDITQLNGSLSMQAATGTRKPGPQLEVISPADSPLPLAVTNRKPMVTWRVTRSCNLNCLNCLSDSRPRRYGSELTTPEGMALISDLAAFEVPRLRFAGGEPLMRADLLELVAYTHERGIQPSLFTRGTPLTGPTTFSVMCGRNPSVKSGKNPRIPFAGSPSFVEGTMRELSLETSLWGKLTGARGRIFG